MEGVAEVHTFRIPCESLSNNGWFFALNIIKTKKMEQTLVHGFPTEFIP